MTLASIYSWCEPYFEGIPMGEIEGRGRYCKDCKDKMAEQAEKFEFYPLIADTYTLIIHPLF